VVSVHFKTVSNLESFKQQSIIDCLVIIVKEKGDLEFIRPASEKF
jgi:hypothetical protein